MGKGQRIGFAVVAAIIAVVAVVLLAGRSDPETNVADTPPAATASPSASAAGGATPTGTPAPTETPKPKPKPKVETVTFRDGAVVGGLAELTFEKGETARFTVASDVGDEIHVHGYDLMKEIPAGGRASFSFPARIDGVFEVELEDRGVQLAELRVEP